MWWGEVDRKIRGVAPRPHLCLGDQGGKIAAKPNGKAPHIVSRVAAETDISAANERDRLQISRRGRAMDVALQQDFYHLV